ncbi:MAG TPA: STAS domain-containing protein [Solirubrobacteraceae bacterium]|nr:STAS domain-containing protein [Solirubrobacteraceae bacterium]
MEAPGRLEISACGEREREPVLRIRGELDLSTISLLAEHVESQLAGGSPPVAFVLDLGGVTFMDSSGLRTLIELNERAHA